MRCLYCGKELALLKRLTGGDFCSDAHKQSYQEEYNRLALSRLLQAQTKGQQTNKSSAQNAPPPPKASVALEEPVHQLVTDHTPNRSSAAPTLEVALTEARTQAPEKLEAAPETVAAEQSYPEVTVDAEPSVGAEPEPLETAGFLLDSPALAGLPEQTPYLESWLEVSTGPAMAEWQFHNGAFSLSPADLLSLDLRLNASHIADQTFPASSSPQAFTSTQPVPAFLAVASAKKIENTNRLFAGGAMTIDIAPNREASAIDESLVQGIGFESTVLFDGSQLLELFPTDIDFPGADSDVVLLVSGRSSSTAVALPETVPGTAAPEKEIEDDSPTGSLEALSRLHQELVEQETTQTKEEPSGSQAAPIEVAAVEVVAGGPDPETAKVPTDEPKSTEEALPPAAEAPKSRFATELFEMSIKTFPPAKPALIGGDAFPSHPAPLLPHLKSLPLRPKMALATGYVPPAAAPAPTGAKPATPAATALHAPGQSKPASTGKPAARLTQPKQPNPSAKPVQAATAKASEPRTAASPKAAAPQAGVPKQQAKVAASQSTPVQEANTARANVSEATPKASPTEKELASKPAPAADAQKPAAAAGKPAANRAKPTADETKKDIVPSFGIAQNANTSWLSSLTVKLGLAAAVLVIACFYFLGWGGGKSSKPDGSNPAGSTDGSGPSIIMGEGGWVEGWAGDPTGLHAGRQITIYRPSLKLSDYRLEFQGTVDAKSLGWVFRASDPDNYYAMKLAVSSGLSSKVALYKYLVANGRQTQVGRVPIALAVQPDTVFAVRVDVRGPQFTTYIQGQQVDSWTDDQLKIGGAGFLNEREERGKVKSVSIRYLSGAAK